MERERFADLRLVDRATVFQDGIEVARLSRADGSVRFGYVDGHLGGGGRPIAHTLDRPEPVVVHGNYLPTFFAGLLPEGRRLSGVRAAVGTSADDEFSLLLAVGDDTIGDVQVVPAGESPGWSERDRRGPADPSTLSFAELFAESIGALDDPAALPGVQDKLSGHLISLPTSLGTGSVILKLEPPDLRGLVRNEAFFLRRAHEAGLRVVTAEVVTDRDGAEALAVARFDRVSSVDGVGRIAVEDGCQVLDRVPGDKYRVGVEAVVNALSEACPARVVAAKELFDQLVFAYLSGNSDLHGKNVSIMRTEDGWRPTPAYDLPTSLPYPLDPGMALPVDGAIRSQLSLRLLLGLASTIGLPERAARRSIGHLVAAAESWPDLIEAELEWEPVTQRAVFRSLRHRRDGLARDLSR